ncbi:helix-turn-helix transcriptional regulator [Streptomyces sp. JJ36]|uniref:helix-turn-helix domain-containing protein n=1 Tax=Streptomyces sp. JJ36 TaxID=2736645 RepID=UPI001F2150DD|nr:helix-turn-helix transcriptional regulator [Streptomyces sp. JJ36]MCF6522694.1 helix-turn-helix domain-containing protein [Streptomyces sp. JJ36]
MATDDPALNRRTLREALREARVKAGMTQRQAADALEWSLSKIIRIEAATVSLSVTDLRAMLQLYDVQDPETVRELEHAARHSKGNSWWAEFSSFIRPQFAQLLSYEGAASEILAYHPVLVSGYVQTYDYAMALLSAQTDEEQARRSADLRMKRYERIFEAESGPEVHLVVDEAALLRQIGTPAVMRNQLRHLKAVAANPRVDLRVLPLTAGAHYSVQYSFTLLSFSGGENDLLYQESAVGALASSDEIEHVATYRECFEDISERSAQGDEALALIDRALERFTES